MSEATICKDGHWIHTECRAYEAGKAESEARIIEIINQKRAFWERHNGDNCGDECWAEPSIDLAKEILGEIAAIKGKAE